MIIFAKVSLDNAKDSRKYREVLLDIFRKVFSCIGSSLLAYLSQLFIVTVLKSLALNLSPIYRLIFPSCPQT